MIALDWTALGLGAVLGIVAGGLFFAGLAWGMVIALRGSQPGIVLVLSAALRIAALLFLTWWVAGQGMFGLAGFALGFVCVRIAILIGARLPPNKEASPWN